LIAFEFITNVILCVLADRTLEVVITMEFCLTFGQIGPERLPCFTLIAGDNDIPFSRLAV